MMYMNHKMNEFNMRFVHSIDKMDLFLYLFERWLIMTKREYFDFPYNVTLDNQYGTLQMTAVISEQDRKDINHTMIDAMACDLPELSLSLYEMGYIDYLFDKYRDIDYDSLIGMMFMVEGNTTSPETINYLTLPMLLDKETIKEVLGR